ncbi:MAG TPA: hypothetical protein VJ872_08915 [Nocardioides sp.]|nr:hypothetical protein [Nocardioides sp.]
MSVIVTTERLVRSSLRTIAHAIVHPVETVGTVVDELPVIPDVAEATATALMDALQQSDEESTDWLMRPRTAPQ